MRYIVSILFLFVTFSLRGQVFSQTFVDRCTGEVQVVTANFTNGSATVAFYNRVRVFTYQEFVSGELQSWLIQTYSWWNSLSPCSTATAQAQQAQQTAQSATSAANAAANAASSATQNTTTNGTTTVNTNNSTTNTNQTTSNNNTTGSTESNNTSGSSGSSSTSEGSSGTSESSGETKTEETGDTTGESNESSGETKETTEEGDSGNDKEDTDDGSGGDEDKESEEVEKKEEKKKEEKKEKKKTTMLPIQLRADALTTQSPLGFYSYVLNLGVSQSSIFGDKTYTGNLMVWDNMNQVSLSGGITKVHLNRNYQVKFISSNTLNYSRNFKTNVIMYSTTQLKPLGKYGTVGMGASFGTVFEHKTFDETTMFSYMGLYTNSFQLGKRITYSPALIFLQTPLMSTNGGFGTHGLDFHYTNELVGQRIHFMGVLSNSFTVQLTQRFSFNVAWTLIKSSDNQIPTMNSFMVGAKLPF